MHIKSIIGIAITSTTYIIKLHIYCCCSLEECGRYLETIKVYENKPADIIQGQMDTDYLSRVNFYGIWSMNKFLYNYSVNGLL